MLVWKMLTKRMKMQKTTRPIYRQRLSRKLSGVGRKGEAIGPIAKQIIMFIMLNIIITFGETEHILGKNVIEEYETTNVNKKQVI